MYLEKKKNNLNKTKIDCILSTCKNNKAFSLLAGFL